MKLSNTNNNITNIPVFNIDGGELFYIAKDLYKLPFNKLSPFSTQPVGGVAISEEAKKLVSDIEFQQLVKVLAQPDLKLDMRRGGETLPFQAQRAYIKKQNGAINVVHLQDSKGMVAAYLFDSLDKFGEYFSAQNASTAPIQPLNLIPTKQPIELLMFIFNLADCYGRAYLNSKLAYSTEPIDAIYEDEFISVLQTQLKSNDVRWLIPSLIKLVPNFTDIELNFSGRQLELAESMDFISRAANEDNKRPIYFLGNNGKYIGVEFSLFFKYAVGFEISSIDPSTEKTVSQGKYYFAPTEEANHLITFTKVGDGVEFIHQALEASEVGQELENIIITKLDNLAEIARPKTTPFSAKPVELNFCPNCGAKVAGGAAFCANCGKKLK